MLTQYWFCLFPMAITLTSSKMRSHHDSQQYNYRNLKLLAPPSKWLNTFTDHCTKSSYTLHYMHSNPESQSGDRRMRGYSCADADELATGCTVGEQLPWQQQTSKLRLRKMNQSVVSGERDARSWLMIQWACWAIAIASCRCCNTVGGRVTQAASPHTHLALLTSYASCLHGVCRLYYSRYCGQLASVCNNWRPIDTIWYYRTYLVANFTAQIPVAEWVPRCPGTCWHA